MPLDEEGVKWSCEPCIRGHRSSKCQHFDRLMMKVPKAGRPLAKCPHPKGSCSCQKTYAFMVRIPKGSTCLCRPLYKVPMDANDSSQTTLASVAPMSSPTPGKVQKSGRRQSNLQAAPENIAKALNAISDTSNINVENEMPDFSSDQPTMSQEIGNSTPQPISQSSGCCTQELQAPATAPSGGSCCGKSGPPSTDNAVSDTQKQTVPQTPSWDDLSFIRTSAPQLSSWQNPSTPAHGQFMQSFGMHGPRLFPSTYMNSYMQDVSSPASLAYSGQMNGLGISQASMPSFPSDQPANSSNATPAACGGDPNHECNCGDDCQCLGCASHPFNNTTLQHVQEMGVIMTFDGDDQTPDPMPSAYQSSPFQASAAATTMNFSFMHSTPSLDHAAQDNSLGPYSDPNSNLPSGYSSPLPAGHPLSQPLMHPSEYYTLEYPVGLPNPCSDVTGSCQCGSDCSCVGCLTHNGHNGVPFEASIPESSISEAPEQHSSSHAQATQTPASSLTARIPVLDNVSVPCMSPRTWETSMV